MTIPLKSRSLLEKRLHKLGRVELLEVFHLLSYANVTDGTELAVNNNDPPGGPSIW